MKCDQSRLLMNVSLVVFLIFQLFTESLLDSSPPEEEETLIEDFFICRSCGHDISLSNFLIDKHSPLALSFSNHTLAIGKPVTVQEVQNSLGIRFKIVVVRQGYCAKVVSWNTVHTWFPGYAWKLCVCPECRTHLGWMFEPIETATFYRYFPSEKGFYALIYNNIISERYVNSLLMREKALREN
ncbi:uncharacterized protein LOC129755837 [Uranotaenia lowii]|uniref:uncharacterized protein LOC129755837 n=1 Tax=Uranotaenia lowii TaxID=190385 RepID=UPI002478CB23|nr:uncharacterized protein LOC129755837 [Uranotaenia lowii]